MEKAEFSEYEFVELLFCLLVKNGVSYIDVNDLKKKLYFYYKNHYYREIFQNIFLSKGSFSGEVNINEGLNYELYRKNVLLYSNENKLFLAYPMSRVDWELFYYEKELGEEYFKLMNQMALELVLRYNIESKSAKKLLIYGAAPRAIYTLVQGKHFFEGDIVGLELISDGIVKSKRFLDQKTFGNCFFDSPYFLDEKMQIQDPLMADVFVENASYAILRGMANQEVQHARVWTNILDENKLRQICEIANTSYYSSENLAMKGEPFVRKIRLK